MTSESQLRSESPPRRAPSAAADRRTRWVVVAMAGAAFVASLDLFVVNVAFSDIGHDFGVGLPGGPTAGDLSWVLNAYAVVFAALLVPFGRLADRYGAKRLFVTGLALFVLASCACAIATSTPELVTFRAIQAIGAAAVTPTSLSLLLAALPPERRLAGVRFWAATGAVAAAIGPAVGGVLTQASWRWVFLINLPFGAAFLVIAALLVRAAPANRSAARPDLLGAVLLVITVGAAALGLVKGNDWRWDGPATVGSFAVAVLALLGFVARSSRHPAPVIAPALLRVTSYRFAVIATVLFSVSFGANLLLGSQWMQQVWGWSALTTGFGIALGPVFVPITTVLAHRLLTGVAPAKLITAGCTLCAIGVVYTVTMIGTSPNYWTGYAPGWILGGIGVGLALPNLIGGSTHDLPASMAATGSGVVTMARQIGMVGGVSLMFAVIGSRVGIGAVEQFRTTWWIMAGFFLLAGLVAVGMHPARRVVA